MKEAVHFRTAAESLNLSTVALGFKYSAGYKMKDKQRSSPTDIDRKLNKQNKCQPLSDLSVHNTFYIFESIHIFAFY